MQIEQGACAGRARTDAGRAGADAGRAGADAGRAGADAGRAKGGESHFGPRGFVLFGHARTDATGGTNCRVMTRQLLILYGVTVSTHARAMVWWCVPLGNRDRIVAAYVPPRSRIPVRKFQRSTLSLF